MAEITWIGLGTMGLPMVANLIAAGHRVRGIDLSPEARERAQGEGVDIVDDVAEALRTSEVIVTILPAGKHVRSVFEGEDGILANAPAGTLVVDASTIDVDTSRWCHEQAAAHDLRFVDSPVSGGVSGAEQGTLTFMMGGEPDAKARLSALVEPMARQVVDVGDATAGIAAKICNNLMLFINMLSIAEGSQLAGHLGLDQETFQRIASVSSGGSWVLDHWYPVPDIVPSSPANDGFAPSFPATGSMKDLGLALQVGEGLDLAGARLVTERLQMLVDQGLGDRDCTLIAKLVPPDGKIAGFSGD